ncbi:MAG: ABC transporter permease [Staphylococcus epidermidis]|nr:ABC transporter permease [Staphylococcus epidermidis]
MKPYIQLVIKKQWLQYVFLISTILIALGTLWLGQKLAQQNFKIPIAIQDMDHSSASKKLIKDIEQNQYVTVKHLSHDDFYIDDLVKKKEVIASLEIPKDFSKHLKANDLNKTLLLYSRDDFIGHIAMEIISRSLYEQQIPNIIHEHLDDMKQPQSLDKVKQSYYSHTPQSKIKSVAINKHAHQSISIGIVFVVVIFVSVIQILLHQRLKQNAPLGRLYLVPYSQLKLYLTYISVHVVILMLMLLMISLFMHQPLSILFYLKTLIIVLFYEAGIALLLFKINVLSHRIFMAIIYTVAIGIIYLWIQL